MRWLTFLLFFFTRLLAEAVSAQETLKIQPLVGEPQTYTVQKGDSLYRIARRRDVGLANLMRLNNLSRARVRPGQELLLPTWHILPRNPGTGIILNLPELRVYVLKNGALEARHSVAIGAPGSQTVTGEFSLRNKKKNPTWMPPDSMVKNEGIKDDPVPPGPENPLGDRWMGWSKPGYGFHSTNKPRSIGKAVSHGCVRLYPEMAHTMFGQVDVGMPIYSVYLPVKVGEEKGRFYLSVSPDIYDRGGVSLEAVQKQLESLGLLPLVSETTLRRIVAQKDSYPRRILGADEKLMVNGEEVEGPVAPTLHAGRWYVPAEAVMQALGGQATSNEDGAVTLTLGERAATIQTAAANGEEAEGYVVRGDLMVPARVLRDSLAVGLSWEKGQSLTLSAPDAANAGATE